MSAAGMDEKAAELLELQERMMEGTQALAKVQACACMHIYLHACMRADTHTHARRHTHTHTHAARTHTRTLTPMFTSLNACLPTDHTAQLANQERMRVTVLKRNVFMLDELKVLPDDLKTYKSVGKA